jgi:hypothetical protein
MYAAIRQAKAKPGMADELAGRIKRGAISIISSVPGFLGCYVCMIGLMRQRGCCAVYCVPPSSLRSEYKGVW